MALDLVIEFANLALLVEQAAKPKNRFANFSYRSRHFVDPEKLLNAACFQFRSNLPFGVSTVDEITAAIRSLSREDREELVAQLPEVLPELDGDSKWARIIHDPRPRPALSALGDQIEAQLRKNSGAFPEITDADFDKTS